MGGYSFVNRWVRRLRETDRAIAKGKELASRATVATILLMSPSPQPDPISDLLKRSRTIAVVGLSNNPLRPSHGVSAYMQSNGYHIIPVNPEIKEALGETAYASLMDVPEKIEIVNIFRRPEFVEAVVDQAIQRKLPAIWMQEEVINERAA